MLSVFIGVVLGTLLVIQLPNSHLRHEAVDIADPFSNATGLDQDWAVFAPDPRRIAIDLVARIKYADGSQRTWEVPRSDDVVGAYWDYRWLKYMEHVIRDANRPLWLPLARWIAREERGKSAVVSVELTRRWYDLNPPGPGPDRSARHEFKFFTAPALVLREEGRS